MPQFKPNVTQCLTFKKSVQFPWSSFFLFPFLHFYISSDREAGEKHQHPEPEHYKTG